MDDKRTTVEELREYFNKHYGYISLELTDKELADFLEPAYMQRRSLPSIADQLSDHILAQGLGEVQE